MSKKSPTTQDSLNLFKKFFPEVNLDPADILEKIDASRSYSYRRWVSFEETSKDTFLFFNLPDYGDATLVIGGGWYAFLNVASVFWVGKDRHLTYRIGSSYSLPWRRKQSRPAPTLADFEANARFESKLNQKEEERHHAVVKLQREDDARQCRALANRALILSFNNSAMQPSRHITAKSEGKEVTVLCPEAVDFKEFLTHLNAFMRSVS